MTAVQRRLGFWLVVGAVAVAVSVLLAPVTTVVSYGDAPAGSVTFTEERSIVGFRTSLWLWLGVTVGAVAAVALAALAYRGVRHPE